MNCRLLFQNNQELTKLPALPLDLSRLRLFDLLIQAKFVLSLGLLANFLVSLRQSVMSFTQTRARLNGRLIRGDRTFSIAAFGIKNSKLQVRLAELGINRGRFLQHSFNPIKLYGIFRRSPVTFPKS